MIKPIETRYNGYLFRSRLEARWAVFFDRYGVKYEYEPEGFDLDGVWYLPDFYLPGMNVWAEIKPSRDLDDEKARRFADCCCTPKEGEMSYGGIVVCYGDPLTNKLRFITGGESNDSSAGFYDTWPLPNWGWLQVSFRRLPTGDPCLVIDTDVRKDREFDGTDRVIVYPTYQDAWIDASLEAVARAKTYPKWADAAQEARRARFGGR